MEIKPKKLSFFDFLTSINEGSCGNNLFSDSTIEEKAYVPFMINRGLGYFNDTVLFANEMNRRSMATSRMQYDFLKNSIRPRKRFSKWFKAEESEDLELIKKAYGYSNEKAKQVLILFSSEQLAKLKTQMDVGGKCTKNK